MLTEPELRDWRRDYAADQLTQLADVKRRATTGDGMGGSQAVPLTPESGLACRVVRMKNPRTAIEGGRPVTVADWEVRLSVHGGERAPETLDVKPTDEVIVGGLRYRVVATDKGRADAPCLKCEAVRVD